MYSATGGQAVHFAEAAGTTAKSRVVLIRDRSVADGTNLQSSMLEKMPQQAVTRLPVENHAGRRLIGAAIMMLGLAALAVN